MCRRFERRCAACRINDTNDQNDTAAKYYPIGNADCRPGNHASEHKTKQCVKKAAAMYEKYSCYRESECGKE